MRILFGPCDRNSGLFYAEDHPDTIFYEDDGEPLLPKIKNLPSGWQPDVVIFFGMNSHQLPNDFAELPYPTVLMTQDWNLSFASQIGCLGMASLVVTDTHGITAVNRWGVHDTLCWQLTGYDPNLHKPRPDEPILYDVSFGGRLNHQIHERRSQVLAQITQLADRFRIGILTGAHGETYAKWLNQSRITLNMSIRGEMNLRGFEAPAAESLMFIEDDNVETRDFLTDEKECIYYNADNLNQKLIYYLEHEDERRRIAIAGRERIQPHSFANRFQMLKQLLAKLQLKPRLNNPFLQLSRAEQTRRLALQSFGTTTPAASRTAANQLRAALLTEPNNPLLQHGFAVCTATFAMGYTGAEQKNLLIGALALFQSVTKNFPNYTLAWVNYGRLLAMVGLPDEAMKAYQGGVQSLNHPDPVHEDDFVFYFYDYFQVRWHRAASQKDPETLLELMYVYLITSMASLTRQSNPTFAEKVLVDIENLSTVTPDTWKMLGLAQSANKHFREAANSFEKSLSMVPFQFDVRQSLLQVYRSLGMNDHATALLEETRRIIRCTPSLSNYESTFRAN